MNMTRKYASLFAIISLNFLFLAHVEHAEAVEKPVKVFILAGQSNMQGHAHVRTLPHIAMDPGTSALLAKIRDSNGNARTHDNVWISSLSSSGLKSGPLTTGYGANEEKIGPELMFGITMSEHLQEKILIIKAAWGGKSIHTDFRPPSAGPYSFSQQQLDRFEKQGKDIDQLKSDKAAATGKFYRLMIDHIHESLTSSKQHFPGGDETRFELAGFVWFQGWNDMVDGGVYPNRSQPGGYDDYTVNLEHFIRDVREELETPELPFVIGVMGVGGPTQRYEKDQQRYKATHQNFRDAMAAVSLKPEFSGRVINVLTENCWDNELADLSKRKSRVDGQIRQLRKTMNKDQLTAKRDELMNAEFTTEETKILETGKSNAEFHYLGSSKIMACIGKAFAEALVGK